MMICGLPNQANKPFFEISKIVVKPIVLELKRDFPWVLKKVSPGIGHIFKKNIDVEMQVCHHSEKKYDRDNGNLETMLRQCYVDDLSVAFIKFEFQCIHSSSREP